MNRVDLIVLAVVALSGLLGLVRGLVREVLGLGAWVLAAVAAYAAFGTAQPIARHAISNPNVADPVAFGVVFLVILIVLSVLARGVSAAIRGSVLGGLDRTLGLVFGLARGAALLAGAYILVGLAILVEQWPPPVLEARTLPLIYRGAAWAATQAPPRYRPSVEPPPSSGRPTTSAALLHANPVGRALGPHPARE